MSTSATNASPSAVADKPAAPAKANPLTTTRVAKPVVKPAVKAALKANKPSSVASQPKASPAAQKPVAPKPRAAKPVSKAAAKPVAKAPVKAAGKDAAPKQKPAKVKMVRDSFTFPQAEHEHLVQMKKRLIALGTEVKKGELVRAGLALLAALEPAALVKAVAGVDKMKTGRPKK